MWAVRAVRRRGRGSMGPCVDGAVCRWGRVPMGPCADGAVALCTFGAFERGVERGIKRSTCWVIEWGTDGAADCGQD